MLTTAEISQLTTLMFLALVLFIVASALPQKIAATVLLVLAPFDAVDTRFGDAGMVLAYVVFIALLLRGERVRLPMLPLFVFLMAWYLISMAFQFPGTYSQHAIYMYTLLSALLVFWLCFDLAIRSSIQPSVLNGFVGANVLVVIYCAVQLWLGPGELLEVFGRSELGMTRVRADGRLTGPFESAEITALYFVIMIFLLMLQFWHTEKGWTRSGLIFIALINLALLIATGSRGEFLMLLVGFAIYLWLFRRRLGPMRALGLAIGGSLAVVAAALIMVTFTQFGTLFDRLAETEVRDGIPDTRQVLWPQTWEEIKKSPIIGHGPRFRFYNEHRGTRYEGHAYMEYPHSLYLFLLYTVGIPGLLLFAVFKLAILRRCMRVMSRPRAPPYAADLARTGVIVLVVFLLDGIKIDQMRLNLADFWYFWFGLCGVLVAACAQIESASVGPDDRSAT